ncbi:MAG: AI-2E family transporter [Deltaproteobacteria bacterium]|nr:AI-2E family transporter [Deltaproteobacteria bacterium]
MQVSKQLVRRWLWGLGGLALFLLLAWKLEKLATLVLLSFLVAYVLNPLVTKLAKLRFLGRTSATLITMLGLLVGLTAMLFVIIPQVASEFRAFLGRLPELTERFEGTAIPWIESTLGFNVPESWSEAGDRLLVYVEDMGTVLVGPAKDIAWGFLEQLFSAFFTFISTLMFPLFLFFLLKDFPRIIEAVEGLVPVNRRDDARELARDVDKSLSAFLHGQFTVMLVLATLYSIGYSIVGVPVAVGVGLLTGLLCFIPYVGAATGFLLALVLAILEMKGWGSIVGVAIVFGVVQVLDAVLITPRILGGKLGLTPLWIILALMAFGELFGFVGVLLAVPTTAVLKILVKRTIDGYRRSSVYLGDGTEKDKQEPETEVAEE